MLPDNSEDEIRSIQIRDEEGENGEKFVVVVLSASVLVFDINGEPESKQVEQAKGRETEELKCVEPVRKIKLKGKTYDYICGFHLDQSNIDDSWLFLTSEKYEKIQMVKLGQFVEHLAAKESGDKTKSLGGHFVQSDEGLLFSASKTTFGSKVEAEFTEDGTQAII